jgi:VCBS repeat-containing protein
VVTGAVSASDADGDLLRYSGSQTTNKGTVVVAPDGSFTYTPTAAARHAAARTTATPADQTDGFVVSVSDGHGGALDVPVTVIVSKASVSFSFVYGVGSQLWSTAARTALQAAAARIAARIIVDRPVTLVYDVAGTNSASAMWLAMGSSPLSSSDPGGHGTVVQTKVLTGIDINGAASDGQLTLNFGHPWAFSDPVGISQYDLQSVALRELVQTLGVTSGLGSPSSIDRTWSTFDLYLATADGTSPIGSDSIWNSNYTSNLTGSNGGLFFSGPRAVAAYGGLVPLYTPNVWSSDTSLMLDPSRAPTDTSCLMTPLTSYGPGVRVLSPVEVGILTDLGYTLD